MSYTPMTPDEAAKMSLRKEGIYPFDVMDAKDALSKEKQNPMIALVLCFYDEAGNRFTIKDWLVHSESRWTEKKFYEFANTTNTLAQYNAGNLKAEDCLARTGFAFIGVEKGKEKEGGGNFNDRNVVKYYTAAKPEARKPEPTADQLANIAPTKTVAPDEDVPF